MSKSKFKILLKGATVITTVTTVIIVILRWIFNIFKNSGNRAGATNEEKIKFEIILLNPQKNSQALPGNVPQKQENSRNSQDIHKVQTHSRAVDTTNVLSTDFFFFFAGLKNHATY